MIPTDPKEIEKLQAMADRNIANGDWGDEVTAPGLLGTTTVPLSPNELAAQVTLSKTGDRKVPKRK
jgi:hypothetical protein